MSINVTAGYTATTSGRRCLLGIRSATVVIMQNTQPALSLHQLSDDPCVIALAVHLNCSADDVVELSEGHYKKGAVRYRVASDYFDSYVWEEVCIEPLAGFRQTYYIRRLG